MAGRCEGYECIVFAPIFKFCLFPPHAYQAHPGAAFLHGISRGARYAPTARTIALTLFSGSPLFSLRGVPFRAIWVIWRASHRLFSVCAQAQLRHGRSALGGFLPVYSGAHIRPQPRVSGRPQPLASAGSTFQRHFKPSDNPADLHCPRGRAAHPMPDRFAGSVMRCASPPPGLYCRRGEGAALHANLHPMRSTSTTA